MSKNRKSIIWKLPKEDFKELLMNSSTYSEVLSFFGLENKGGNCGTLKKRISEECLDDSHIKNNIGKINTMRRRSNDDVFSLNSGYCNSSLKKRLIKDNLIDYKCGKCSIGPEWNGEKLSLQMDHINGNSQDHRIENLRFLCPNCHSQTPTFAGKRKRKIKVSDTEPEPEWRSRDRKHKRKVERPSRDELSKLIKENSWLSIGRMYGVSDNAVRKWAKRYDLI